MPARMVADPRHIAIFAAANTAAAGLTLEVTAFYTPVSVAGQLDVIIAPSAFQVATTFPTSSFAVRIGPPIGNLDCRPTFGSNRLIAPSGSGLSSITDAIRSLTIIVG